MVGFAACSGEVETGKAWTLNANSDLNRLQADMTANLFDVASFPYPRATVDRQKSRRSLADAKKAGSMALA
jgi:hypothetical protein